MENKYIKSFLLIISLLVFVIGIQSAFGQQEYANAVIIENQVISSSQAIDGNLLSSAVINANSGLALGIGAFSGHLEIQFPNVIPVNRTSFIRLNTQDDLLPFLLGGNLGGLLADAAGLVLLGNQEFSIEVKNNNTSILQGDSGIGNAFTNNELRVVTNSAGDYFISVSPNSPYNRIRVTNRVGSLVGLDTQKTINVFGAFYSDVTNSCLNANYTSFNGSGLTLDLLQLGGAGVTNPEFAIDNDANTYSEVGFGIIDVAATMTQTVYFDAPSDQNEVFYITLGLDSSLVQLGLLNNIQVSADNGSTTNVFADNLSNLLDLDLLWLLTDTGTVTIPFRPGVPIDRISINLSSLLGVNLDQKLRIYDVFSAPEKPVIDPNSENLVICAGSTASLIASTENVVSEELVWYNAEVGGIPLAVLNSGESYVTDPLTDSTTFYVAARDKGCDSESPRVAVAVFVSPIPTANDIIVDKHGDGVCNTGEITLAPSSEISDTFNWYFDINGTNEITNNLNVDGIVYSIESNGDLKISGLQDDFSPYRLYVKLTTEGGQCENIAGDFFEVIVMPDDLELEASILIDTIVSLSEVINLSTSSPATVNSQGITICTGTSVDLITTIENNTGLEVRIYDALVNGNLLANVNSGSLFNTGILDATTNFYVGVGFPGCSQESIRATITVNVLNIPTASDIEVSGADEPVCSSSEVVLVPSSDIEGTFEWFFDIGATDQILDGMVNGGVSYTISDTGILTINGLDGGNSPYDYFVRLQQEVADCANANGDLKEVNVAVLDSNFNIDATLDTIITVQDIVDINNDNVSILLMGSVSGDVNEGDTVVLKVNNSDTIGTLDSNLEFSIAVAGFDVLSDADNVVELLISSGICSLTKQLPLPIPDLPIGDLMQVFCASDNPTIFDLQLDLEDGVFFDAMVGGNLLADTMPLVDGGVYFTGLLNLPVNIFTRVAINVQVIEVNPPTTSEESQTFCASDNPVIGDLQVDQDEVVFYDSPTNVTMLDPADELSNGDYYVSRIENGCESENRLRIYVIIIEDSPITLIGETSEVCITNSYTYTYTTESNQSNYIWTVNGGLVTDGGTIDDNFVTVSWNDLQDTFVQVAYLSMDACSPDKELRTEIKTVRCIEVLGADFCLKVFNEFSPNSDGFNDFFEVECITDYVNTTRVYNRNGNLVFETQNYQNDWNGIANVGGVLNKGDHLPAGTYYYVINIPELDSDLVGWLQLAR